MIPSENVPASTRTVQAQAPTSPSGRPGNYLATVAPTIFSLLAISTLLVLVWVMALVVRQPYSGLTWSYTTGVVQTVDPRGPAAALFQPGDRIVAVDGAPVYAARELPGKQAEQWVTFTVIEDSGVESARRLQLAAPASQVLFSRLSPILVALSFWLLGTLVLAFGRSSSLITLFFLFCQAFAALLGLGTISAFGPLWSAWTFNFLLWWIAPLALHTHLLMADGLSSRRRFRLLIGLYGLAMLLSILDLWRLATPAFGILVPIKTLWVGLHLLLSAAVLSLASRSRRPLPSRRRTGIAALAATLAFLPLALFSLLPNGLLGRPLMPYATTMLVLPLLPMGYAYAIRRQQLVRLEPYVNRGVAYALAAIVAGALYAAFYLAQQRVVAEDEWTFSPV